MRVMNILNFPIIVATFFLLCSLRMAPLNIEEDNLEVPYIDPNIDERNYLARDSHMDDVVRALERNEEQGPEIIPLEVEVNLHCELS